jgi:hypothetical protein
MDNLELLTSGLLLFTVTPGSVAKLAIWLGEFPPIVLVSEI